MATIKSIEEKAKRYDEALEIAKEINDEQRAQPFNVMTKVFPELKESEDERIRKALYLFVEAYGAHSQYATQEDMLAWLEKQGEQKSDDIRTTGYWNVQEVEQNPANKVEPKFKVGDYIKPIDKCLGSPRIIEEVYDGWYVTNQGTLDFEFEDNWEAVEEPVSEDLEEASRNYADNEEYGDDVYFAIKAAFKVGAKWQKEKNSILPTGLGEYINELSKQFPEVSFAKLSRIAVRVAKWQKENLWKPADGDDLSDIDREVIALLNNGKVVFAHRPPEYWDGKNIITGKVTRYYPKTYGKGGWNIPDVKFWLDVELPKETEL